MPLAFIKFVNRFGQPIDPDYGVGAGERPDNELPGMEPPVDPGYGRPGFAPGHPGNRPPFAPVRPWPPRYPPTIVDPGWGQGLPPLLPIIIGPGIPLPPVDGGPPPPTDPPPGTIWPPLPPGGDLPSKAALLFWLEGVGYRYVMVDLSGSAAPKPQPPTPQPK